MPDVSDEIFHGASIQHTGHCDGPWVLTGVLSCEVADGFNEMKFTTSELKFGWAVRHLPCQDIKESRAMKSPAVKASILHYHREGRATGNTFEVLGLHRLVSRCETFELI